MSNEDINELVKRLNLSKYYAGTIARDQIFIIKPTKVQKFYVINFETSNEEGSHWVAIIIDNTRCVYFDSYGLPPPAELESMLLTNSISELFFQDEQLQTNSNRCGWFCLFFGIYHLIKKLPLDDLTIKTVNEKIIKDFQTKTNLMK